MAAQVNDPYLSSQGTVDPATTDLSALNFGSAFSSPGSLSSTNLATPSSSTDFSALNDPNYFTSGSPSASPSVGVTGPQDGTGAQPAPSAPAPSGGGFNWGALGSTLGGLAPSLLAGGIGLSQAKGAQTQNDAFAAQLTALGGPYTAAGQQLLKQFQSGQIRPDQTNVANLATSQGQNLIDSGAGLSAIAQAAYKDYQAGKLPPADEQRLSDQTAAQKQEMRQRLSQQGIVDSSILAGYDQQIENQANINRQDLLDKRFATGNTAYDQWLKSTSEGQALKLQGAQFASQSLDNMLNQSLLLGSEGMTPITQAIELKMQSDAQLSGQVGQLMSNLASAYAQQNAPKSQGGTAGALKTIVGDVSAAKTVYGAGQAAVGALGGGAGTGALTSGFAASGAGSAAGTIGLTDATAGLSAGLGAAPATVGIAGGEAAAGTSAAAAGGSSGAGAASIGLGAAAGYAGLAAVAVLGGLSAFGVIGDKLDIPEQTFVNYEKDSGVTLWMRNPDGAILPVKEALDRAGGSVKGQQAVLKFPDGSTITSGTYDQNGQRFNLQTAAVLYEGVKQGQWPMQKYQDYINEFKGH
jgi:hypothetical protein